MHSEQLLWGRVVTFAKQQVPCERDQVPKETGHWISLQAGSVLSWHLSEPGRACPAFGTALWFSALSLS